MNYSEFRTAVNTAIDLCEIRDWNLGFHYEMNEIKKTEYPYLRIAPFFINPSARKGRRDQEITFFVYQRYDNKTEDRLLIWDEINTLFDVFISSLDLNAEVQVQDADKITGHVYDLGETVENALVIEYTVKIYLLC